HFLSLPLNFRSHCSIDGSFPGRRATRRISAIAIVVALSILGLKQPVYAGNDASPSVTINRVDAGFHGKFKVGRWTQVTVQVTTTGPARLRPVFEISDPDGSATRLPGDIVEVAAGGTH